MTREFPVSFILIFRLCAKAYTDSPPVSRDGKTRGSYHHAPRNGAHYEPSGAKALPTAAQHFRSPPYNGLTVA